MPLYYKKRLDCDVTRLHCVVPSNRAIFDVLLMDVLAVVCASSDSLVTNPRGHRDITVLRVPNE